MPPVEQSRPSVLVVDDEEHAAALVAEALEQLGYTAEGVRSGPACLERLASVPAELVLVDAVMPDMTGIELCDLLRQRHPHVLPIIVTGRHDTDFAVAAIRAGAFDYLTKPVSLGSLELAVGRAFEHLALLHELHRLADEPPPEPVDGIVAISPSIRNTLELVHRIAASDTTVLITGESGTGKERVARAVHQLSDRREQRFVAINCSAMPVPLLESELFGHVRGAFTGADRDRAGLLLHAAHGTILLDEIGDMPLEMQAKLLRVLQERSIRAVGANYEVPLDARVIAATSRDLEAEVAAGRFRKDLFHRINVVAIPVPPLRERQPDILPLAHTMLAEFAARTRKPVRGMTAPTARFLLEYEWPGNIRELENCMERAVTVCRLDRITVDDLPDKLCASCGSPSLLARAAPQDLVTLAEMKLRYLRKALWSCRGNKSMAARILGIDRRTISHLLVGRRPRPPEGAGEPGPQTPQEVEAVPAQR